MAKWRVNPGSAHNTLKGSIDYTDTESRWQVEQDEKPFIDWAKQERETHTNKHTHMRKFCTIPDIVAIEIMEKYGLDIHSPEFMHDSDALTKLKKIIQQDYKYLVVSS